MRTRTPGDFESYDVAAENLSRTVRSVRKQGGRVTRSAPTSAGYRLTVFWAA